MVPKKIQFFGTSFGSASRTEPKPKPTVFFGASLWLILSYVHLYEYKASVKYDFNLSKIESLSFVTGENLFFEDSNFLRFSYISYIDLIELTNLKKLTIFNHSMKNFNNLLSSSLEVLDLDRNKIEKINENTFIKTPNLTQLHLNVNELNYFTKKSFNGLRNLKVLDLSSNRITKLDNGIFSELIRISELNLSENYLKDFHEFDFDGLRKLNILNLSQQFDLTRFIHKYTFKNLENLNELNLKDNSLEMFDFEFPKSLKSLNLESSYLVGIEPNQFNTRCLSNLEELNLSSNSMIDVYFKN
ncbi:unnamed protein product [Brachionus calyciflorus]|uniref:Uncharacterized protein n=1 Tax=Brachionus calyciflorus TaxID=104777 RepID=A0A814LJQ4_9BILA|nr:unnamed protein product [Brachionus calyciflorus]